MQALTIALLTRHNDIPATESPAPISAVSESVTTSGADTVFTHTASAVCWHHNAADRTRMTAFGCLTCANVPLFPPCKNNSPAERARFLPLRMRLLLWSANINHALASYLCRYRQVFCDKKQIASLAHSLRSQPETPSGAAASAFPSCSDRRHKLN